MATSRMSDTPSTPTFTPYPETPDLRRLLSHTKRNPPRQPTKFIGTTKVHGTNITLMFRRGSPDVQIQSRNRIISVQDDNYDAAKFLHPYLGALRRLLVDALGLKETGKQVEEVMLAGEYAGKGIVKGAAVCEVKAKFFVIFGVRVDGAWMPSMAWREVKLEEARIFNACDFGRWEVTLDLRRKRGKGMSLETAAKVFEEVTEQVGKECPVARQVGGIVGGVGEGVVWTEEREKPLEKPLRFKTKGEGFLITNGAKAKVVLAVAEGPDGSKTSNLDEEVALAMDKETIDDPEAKASGNSERKAATENFVEYALTKARMEQALEFVREIGGLATVEEVLIDLANIPVLVIWVVDDIVKEEGDVLEAKGIALADMQVAGLSKVQAFFDARKDEIGLMG